MNFPIYAIKDVKAGSFMNLWTESNDNTAERNFDTIRKDTSTIFGTYPTDFELWGIGVYDNNTGEITPEVRYIKGGRVLEVLQQG